MTAEGQRTRRSPHLIVCGDNPLAYRLVEELVTRIGDEVTVILPLVERNHGSRIAALPKVRVIEAPELSEGAFLAAQVEQASAVALVNQDDVGNIHAALRAQELNTAGSCRRDRPTPAHGWPTAPPTPPASFRVANTARPVRSHTALDASASPVVFSSSDTSIDSRTAVATAVRRLIGVPRT